MRQRSCLSFRFFALTPKPTYGCSEEIMEGDSIKAWWLAPLLPGSAPQSVVSEAGWILPHCGPDDSLSSPLLARGLGPGLL